MREAIEAFLAQPAVAVVGVSRTKGFANGALDALRAAGYRAYPVNHRADEVHGERCWRSIADLPERVGAALVVVPPGAAPAVVRECRALGVAHVWLQQGAESPAALALAREAKLSLVHGECIRMYVRPRGVHRLHRWVHDLGARP